MSRGALLAEIQSEIEVPFNNVMHIASLEGASTGSRPVMCSKAMGTMPIAMERTPMPPQISFICYGNTHAARPLENTPKTMALPSASASPKSVFFLAAGSMRRSPPSTSLSKREHTSKKENAAL